MRIVVLFTWVLVAGLSVAGAARADGSGEPGFRRWGLGWDDGIALRYRPQPGWGLGIRVNPDIADLDSSSPMAVGGNEEKRTDLAVGLLGYREVAAGKWVRIGPYARIDYDYSRLEAASSFVADPYRQFRTTNRTVHTWHWGLGLRPAFAIEDRFVLETRFGISVTRQTSDEDRLTSIAPPPQEVLDHEERSLWSVGAVGTNLGFGSVLQFIIYF